MKRSALLCVLFALFLPAALRADEVRLFVVYADGKGFMLVRDGAPQYVDFASRSPVGMELKAGDTVNLDSRSTIELRLFPTDTVIKALASSSFTVKAVYANGTCDLDVAFGRLRTKTDDHIAAGEFSYNGLEIATGAGGTDFGFDFVFGAGRELEPVVSCLAGSLAVSRASASLVAGGAASAALAAGESLQVESGAGGGIAFDKSRATAALEDFWRNNDFVTRPSRAAAGTPTPGPGLALNDVTPSPSPVTNPPSPEPSLSPSPSPSASPSAPPPFPSPSPSPSPAPRNENTGQRLSQNGIATPPLVDNTEGGLGPREKLSAVDQRDIVANPDLARAAEKSPEPSPSPEPKAEPSPAPSPGPQPSPAPTPAPSPQPTPAPTPAPAPQPAPAPAPAGPSPIGFTLDLGLEINYLSGYSYPSLSLPAPFDIIGNLLNLAMSLKAGVSVNADITFFDIFGVGVTTGLFYNPFVTVDASYNPVFNHLFFLPALVNIRVSLLIVFVEVYGGVVFSGIIPNGGSLTTDLPLTYLIGAKGGLKLGGLILYANFGLWTADLSTIFTSSTILEIGGGIAFKIF